MTDLQADLSQGAAVWAVGSANEFRVHLDRDRRASSVGSWVEKQGYDFSGRSSADLAKLFAGDFKKRFEPAMSKHAAQFLTRSFPNVVDPIFPDDPRYTGHIVRIP